MLRYVLSVVLLSGCAAPAVREFDSFRRDREPVREEPVADELDRSLTLAKARAMALARHPSLEEARLRVAAARERITIAGSLEEPKLKLETWAVPLDNPVSFRRADTNMIGLSQAIPFPGKLEARARAASEQALASLEESLARGTEIVAAVDAAYFEYGLALRELAVHREYLKNLEEVSGLARDRYASGKGTQAEALKAQAAVVMLHNDVVFAEQRVGVARLSLNALLARDLGAPLAEPLAEPPRQVGETLDDLIARAASRPSALMARHAVSSAEADRDGAALDAWLPDFEVGLDYWQRPSDRDALGAMFVMNLPWFGAARGASRREAERMVEVQQAVLRREELLAAREVREAFLAVRASEDSLAVLKGELLPLARQGFEAALTAWKNGAGTLLEALDARRGLLDAELGAERAAVARELAVSRLIQAAGGEKKEVVR